MTHTTLLARCSAAAATATLLAGLAAAPAMARPDPGGAAPQQIEQNDGSTKAAIDHNEMQWLKDSRNKAQIEHAEQLSVPSTGTSDDVTSAPDEFPWVTVSFAAAGLAAAATGGVLVMRQRRTALASA